MEGCHHGWKRTECCEPVISVVKGTLYFSIYKEMFGKSKVADDNMFAL